MKETVDEESELLESSQEYIFELDVVRCVAKYILFVAPFTGVKLNSVDVKYTLKEVVVQLANPARSNLSIAVPAKESSLV